MAIPSMRLWACYSDPRGSLVSAIGWPIFILSIALVPVACAWVDSILRTNLLRQRELQPNNTASRIAAELNFNLAPRLQSMRALAALLAVELRDENQTTLRAILVWLQQVSPEFEWISVVTAQSRVLAYGDTFTHQVRRQGVDGLIKALAAKSHTNDMPSGRAGA